MSQEEKSGEVSGVAGLPARGDLEQPQSRGICPDDDPYQSHLSDRRHFAQATDPKDGHRSLGAYPPHFMFRDDD